MFCYLAERLEHSVGRIILIFLHFPFMHSELLHEVNLYFQSLNIFLLAVHFIIPKRAHSFSTHAKFPEKLTFLTL